MNEPLDIAECARRMHEAGHGLIDIASKLQTHPEQIRRWLALTPHNEAAEIHAQRWQAQGR